MAGKAKATGLGRGFEALIPQNFDSSLLANESERVQKLLISDVVPNKAQPRTEFDDELLQELAASIKQHGILQPLVVSHTGDGTYRIVAGERRWRAAQLAGLSQIPAIVRTMEELEELEIALVENVQRVDLSPLDQAVSILRLHDQFSMAYDEIAKRLGKSVPTISNTVRLLQLTAEQQEALRDGLINEGHARALLALKGLPEKQAALFQFIIKNHWSVRQAEQFVVAAREIDKGTQAAKKRALSTTPATEKLSKKLGAKVSIRRRATGGVLEIPFKGDGELTKIMRYLNK
jgi:ParB family chromosome partitioning protein